MGPEWDGATVKGTTPAVGCSTKCVLPGRRLRDASGCILACLSPQARAGEGSGRTERSPSHSQRRCYFNNTPLACMPGLILTLEPRQAGPNFPCCDLSQPFPFENKAPVPAPLSPQAAARCHGSCPTGQGKAGQDLPLGRLFGEREGGRCRAPLGAQPPAAYSMGIFGSWLEAGGCSNAETSPGSWSGSVFHRHLWEGGGCFFLLTFLLKTLWGALFFAFVFSPFSQSTAMLEKEISLRLCASI